MLSVADDLICVLRFSKFIAADTVTKQNNKEQKLSGFGLKYFIKLLYL